MLNSFPLDLDGIEENSPLQTLVVKNGLTSNHYQWQFHHYSALMFLKCFIKFGFNIPSRLQEGTGHKHLHNMYLRNLLGA